ncbi:tetratricopeptide repeat protein [Bradyrhizobium guangdongense]
MTVNDTHVRRISAVLQADTESFAMLTIIGGLDPAQSFRRADLSGVNFGTDNLSKFDFSYANLSGANLSNATGLHWSMLVNAQFDDRTMLPDDLRWLGIKKWDRDTYWRLHDSKRYDEALAFCRLVQRHCRQDVSARVFEAHMLEAHFGKVDEAIKLMRKALKIDPGEANFYFFLAQALKTKGEIGKAKRAYMKAASLTDGENKARILVDIAELLVEYGRGTDKSLEIHRLLDDAFEIGKTTLSLVSKIFDMTRQIGDVRRSITYAREMLQQVSAIEEDENWENTLRLLKPLVKDGNAGELADALKGMKLDSKLGMLRNALLAIAGEKPGPDENGAIDTIRRQLLDFDLDVGGSETLACA